MTADEHEHDEAPAAAHRVWDLLEESEREQAARTSYEYFVASELDGDRSGQQRAALEAIRRFLAATHGNEKKALSRLRGALAWRTRAGMDRLRACFDARFEEKEEDREEGENPASSPPPSREEDRKGLRKQMEAGKFYTRGYDKDGQAVIFLDMGNYNVFDQDYYQEFHFLMLERALAATERNTNGREHRATAVLDYSNYGLRNSIPPRLAKNFLAILADHYPDRLEKIFLVDAPFVFWAFWVMIKPFIDPVTKSKVAFVSGDQQKEARIGPCIDADQASPGMLPNAGNTRPFDAAAFLETTPFDRVFGEATATETG